MIDKIEINGACIDKQPITYGWVPVTERLPEEGINPVTQDAYVYPVTVDFGNVRDVRYYSFCHGHWYNQGPGELDDIVIAWAPRLEPFRADAEARELQSATQYLPQERGKVKYGRLTEPCGAEHFRIRGNNTVYNRNPPKSSRVSYALAKLFQYEDLEITPEGLRPIKADYDSLK